MLKQLLDGVRPDDESNGLAIDYAANSAGDVDSAGVLMQGFLEFLATLHLDVVDASTTLVFKVQESDDDTTYTDVPDATSGTIAAATANEIRRIHVDWRHPDRKKYARVRCVVAGSNSADFSVDTLRGNAVGGDISKSASMIEA